MDGIMLVFSVRKVTFLLSKIHKNVATGAVLVAQICTKSFVGWVFASDPTGGAYSAPQTYRFI